MTVPQAQRVVIVNGWKKISRFLSREGIHATKGVKTRNKEWREYQIAMLFFFFFV